MKRSALSFLWSDVRQHGGGGDTMGKPAKSATEADRQGWANSDATHGFSRGVGSGGGRRSIFGRRR